MMLARRLKTAASERIPLAAGERSIQTEGVNVEEHKRLCPSTNDLKWVDQFPYVPSYRFHPYRSVIGATGSILLGFIFFLRIISSTMDFVEVPPIVTESRMQFPRDSNEEYALPRVGVQFRQNGWKPFNDPRYMQIAFDQGVIHKSGNISHAHLVEACPPPPPPPHAHHVTPARGELSRPRRPHPSASWTSAATPRPPTPPRLVYARYTSLGTKECSFVDRDGRLIADDARCPRTGGYMQGDFHDVTFSFVRARLARCDNGTDVEGKPLPGMCMTPAAIDATIYEGVLYLFEQEDDMRVDSDAPFMRIRQWRREFVTGAHLIHMHAHARVCT